MQHLPETEEQLSSVTAPTKVLGMVDDARELSALLGRAAELASTMGIELDTWMREAWSAFVDAKPGFREHLEDMQLIAQLTALRQNGRIGQA